jgi:hypothetical protein
MTLSFLVGEAGRSEQGIGTEGILDGKAAEVGRGSSCDSDWPIAYVTLSPLLLAALAMEYQTLEQAFETISVVWLPLPMACTLIMRLKPA